MTLVWLRKAFGIRRGLEKELEKMCMIIGVRDYYIPAFAPTLPI